MANAQDIQWSKTEKSVAKRAFESAYGRSCEAITKRLNGMIRDIADPVHGTRRYLLPNFPFSFVYRVHNEEIEIVAVAHHWRYPGYWRSR